MRISEMYKDFKLYSILTTGQLYKLRANTGYELDVANSSSNTVLDLSTLNPLSSESYLFVVDNVSQIKGINEWMCYRMLKNDSVMDINGFVQTLAEIQKTQNSREGTKALLFLDIMGASSVRSGIDLLPKISTDSDDYQQEQVLISEKGAYKIVHKTDMLFEVDILKPYTAYTGVDINNYESLNNLFNKIPNRKMCRCIVEIVIPDNVTRITEDDKLKIPYVMYEWMTKAMIEYTDYRGEGRKFILYEVEVFSKYLKMEETVMLTEDTATSQINVDDKSEKIKDILERLGRPDIEVNKIEALIPTVDLSANELCNSVKFALTWL